MREVHDGVGVHVGRVLALVDGRVVVVDVGSEVELLVGVLVEDVLVGPVLVDDGVVDDGVGVDEVPSVVSCSGRSSTGGGSAGAAATRNPIRTSTGTDSMTARSMPSRPSLRRGAGVMPRGYEGGVSPG